jgi:endo-1,4-beta-xylanase
MDLRIAISGGGVVMASLVAGVCSTPVMGQTPVLPTEPMTSYAYYDAVPGGGAVATVVSGQPFTRGVRITTAGTGSNVYDAQLGWNTAAAVSQGDLLLLTFWARRLSPLDGRTIDAQVVMERNGGDYLHSLTCSFPNDTASWQRYSVPFRAAASHAAGEARVAFQFSIGPQSFEIGGVSLSNYGQAVSPGTLNTAFYYPGREAGAPWRAQAAARINQIRKGPMTVNVVNCLGEPVEGANVQVTLTRHAFGFGTAIASNVLVGSGANADAYRAAVTANFSSAVIENHLKWPVWESWGRSDALASIDWLNARGIRTLGHNLIWPSFGYMPADCAGLTATALRGRIDAHFADILNATRGKLTEWDVINEPYSEYAVQGRIGGVPGVAASSGVLPNGEMVRWFQNARAIDPAIGLALNDYNVLEGVDPNHRAYTMEVVRWLLASNAPVTRLGLQGHFGAAIIPIPELERRIATLMTLPVRMSITEFDLDILDESLQADYTRDVLTLIFSQERFDEFLVWGFWEGAHWLPNGAMFRMDWSPKPNAAAWRDLIYNQWHTSVSGVTDAAGRMSTAAFYGQCRIEVTLPGGPAIPPTVATASFTAGGQNVTVVVPAPIVRQPASVNVCPGGVAEFAVPGGAGGGGGGGAATYRWQTRLATGSPTWVNLPNGVTTGLGVISGATSSTLRLSGVPAVPTTDSFRCIITGAVAVTGCATVTSGVATLRVTRGCSIADVAGTGAGGSGGSARCGDGTVDGSDFIAFINSFAIGDAAVDAAADVAGGGADGVQPDGTIDGADFIAFINAFAVGC